MRSRIKELREKRGIIQAILQPSWVLPSKCLVNMKGILQALRWTS